MFYRVCILNIDVQLLENAKYTQQVQITIKQFIKEISAIKYVKNKSSEILFFSFVVFLCMFILVVIVVVEALNGGTTAGRDNATTVASQRGRTVFRGVLKASCTGWSPPRSQHHECISGQRARCNCPRSAPAPGTSGDDSRVSMPPPAVGSLSSSSSSAP